MKKSFVLYLLVVLLVSVTATALALQEVPEVIEYSCGEYKYILLSDETAEIVSHKKCNKTHITIPEMLDGHVVTSIKQAAFTECDDMLSVEIPSSINVLVGNPFKGSSSLQAIQVATDHPLLATIDGILFDKTTKTLVCYPIGLASEKYVIPKGICAIGDSAFWGGDLCSITIPDSVTSIGNEAFYFCEFLNQIQLPPKVTFIGDGAFGWCKKLANIKIPDGVTFIGDQAFFECKSLTSITIPNSVTTLVGNPFVFCVELEQIKVSSKHPVLETIDGVLYDKQQNALICCPADSGITQHTISQGTTQIRDYAFYDVSSLKNVTLPNSVTSIGNSAFGSCEKLSHINIPNGVLSIGNSAFSFCEALTDIILPNSVVTIGRGAFGYCDSLISIVLPNSVTTIGERAFELCDSLRTVTIPSSVTSIGKDVFYAYSGSQLKTSAVVESGSYAEEYCIKNQIAYSYLSSTDWLTD